MRWKQLFKILVCVKYLVLDILVFKTSLYVFGHSQPVFTPWVKVEPFLSYRRTVGVASKWLESRVNKIHKVRETIKIERIYTNRY